jgi:hypothetical protein
MSCEKSATCPSHTRAKSPLKIALAISVAIAAGTVASTLDASIFETILNGRFLTGAFAEAQEHQAAAIASLERKTENFAKDLDFVASRVGTSMRRNEDQTFDRFAQLDAEVAELKNKITLIQTANVAPRTADPLLGGSEKRSDSSAEVAGLRTSLHELSSAHTGAVAAITRRLDRIEVMVGLSTDVVSSVANQLELRRSRRKAIAKLRKPVPVPQAEAAADGNHPERGHLFNVKPIGRQGTPLRVSKLAN